MSAIAVPVATCTLRDAVSTDTLQDAVSTDVSRYIHLARCSQYNVSEPLCLSLMRCITLTILALLLSSAITPVSIFAVSLSDANDTDQYTCSATDL